MVAQVYSNPKLGCLVVELTRRAGDAFEFNTVRDKLGQELGSVISGAADVKAIASRCVQMKFARFRLNVVRPVVLFGLETLFSLISSPKILGASTVAAGQRVLRRGSKFGLALGESRLPTSAVGRSVLHLYLIKSWIRKYREEAAERWTNLHALRAVTFSSQGRVRRRSGSAVSPNRYRGATQEEGGGGEACRALGGCRRDLIDFFFTYTAEAYVD